MKKMEVPIIIMLCSFRRAEFLEKQQQLAKNKEADRNGMLNYSQFNSKLFEVHTRTTEGVLK